MYPPFSNDFENCTHLLISPRRNKRSAPNSELKIEDYKWYSRDKFRLLAYLVLVYPINLSIFHRGAPNLIMYI